MSVATQAHAGEALGPERELGLEPGSGLSGDMALERAAGSNEALAGDVLAHLAAQIGSVERLLEIVLEQGAAIRARDVHAVVRLAGILRGEMSGRQPIEEERERLLQRSGELLGIPAETVTLTGLGSLMGGDSARRAAERGAELRGLLHELQREHSCNRAMMQIELSFLDHLMKTLALDEAHGYDSQGSSSTTARARPHSGLRVLDLHA